MIWIDYAILAVVGISGVVSLMRGFLREALSLIGWIAAFWVAIAFSGEAAILIEAHVSAPSVRHAIAFAVLFVGVLLLSGVVLHLMGLLVEKTGLSGTDRTLGILFGVLRGVVIVGLLVLLAGLTPLPRDPWWSRSVFLPHFERVANEIRAFLPPDIQERIRFGPGSGPAPGTEPEPAPGLTLGTEPEPASGTESGPAPGTEPEPASGTESGPASGTESGPAPGTEPEPASGTESGPAG